MFSFSRKVVRRLERILSYNLPIIGKIIIGLRLVTREQFPFLGIGTREPFFQESGNIFVSRQRLKRKVTLFAKHDKASLIAVLFISFRPEDLLISISLATSAISIASFVRSTFSLVTLGIYPG